MIDTLKEPKKIAAEERGAKAAPKANEERGMQILADFAKAESAEIPSWLQGIRGKASARAAELGFPTIRDEEWKFTNMAPLAQLPLHRAHKSNANLDVEGIREFILNADCYRLVFVDGLFCGKLSVLPEKGSALKAGNLASVWACAATELQAHLARHARFDSNFFTALNTAFFQDGAFVSIEAGQKADKPVHLLYINSADDSGASTFPRNLILAGPGAEVKIVESHVAFANVARFTNVVTELVLGANARIEHCRVQQENEASFHVAAVQAVLAKDSRWVSHSISLGARVARNQVQALFEAEGGEAVLNGLYLGHGEQLVDHHTVVDHAKPHCESHEFYHGILADRAHGVFNGKIFVRKDAQKTNAKQNNRNLLLSDNAMIDTKPQLEIFADDVKCTHGATVGQLDNEELFYLQARGIGIENARRMLIQAFASDVVGRIGIEAVQAQLEEKLAGRFMAVSK